MTRPPWHALLAPLPPDVVPRREPVAAADVRSTPAGAIIAGWEKLVLELSAGAHGLRVVLVVCDRGGTVISASDWVLHRSNVGELPSTTSGAAAECRHESVGGRFEPDGSFRGTAWRMVGAVPVEGQAPQWESTPSEPTRNEVAALRAVAAQLLERAGVVRAPERR